MVGSASGPGSTFKAFLGSARVWVPLSNKIQVRVGSVQNFWTREDLYCQVHGFPAELGYFNTVSAGCPRVEAIDC